jgi:hypothetical protein
MDSGESDRPSSALLTYSLHVRAPTNGSLVAEEVQVIAFNRAMASDSKCMCKGSSS